MNIEKEKDLITKERENISLSLISEGERLSTNIKTNQRDIQNLIKDFKNIQTEINELTIQEKQLNQLYQILSKELALLILQDHLPILNDIINTFLSQVVDYQINLNLVKTSSDRIELEANIIDTKGEREIKSLSGGQKIILKLVWMLAISAYMNSPILFLDETINNLDNDTVGKVAGMLEDTVKQRSIKIYTVTHNQQIQEMNIRDKTIELNTVL
jgi:DNA repair exonuclease SbcCD ATPase subunit